MDKVINLGIPHVGELIFESIDTPGLIQYLSVSETWKVLAETVLVKRWKGKMFKACKSGKAQVVELLIKRCNAEESGLNIKDKNGWTAFMWACRNGHKDVVKLLLDNSERIDLNARTNNGKTAFMWACYKGHKDVIQLILAYSDRNIDFNASNIYGNTAFTWACQFGDKDVVKLLLEHLDQNIELNARSSEEWTAFILKNIATSVLVQCLLVSEPWKVLAENVLMKRWKGKMFRACEIGETKVVQLLLERCNPEECGLNIKDEKERTAFMAACRNGHKDVVQLLLDYSEKIELNAKNDFGNTAFM